jgi:hypothetical protein
MFSDFLKEHKIEKAEKSIRYREEILENLQKNEGLFNNQYRLGSDAFFEFIEEARKMYFENLIEVDDVDADILESDLGQWGQVNGEWVPLDCPLMEVADTHDWKLENHELRAIARAIHATIEIIEDNQTKADREGHRDGNYFQEELDKLRTMLNDVKYLRNFGHFAQEFYKLGYSKTDLAYEIKNMRGENLNRLKRALMQIAESLFNAGELLEEDLEYINEGRGKGIRIRNKVLDRKANRKSRPLTVQDNRETLPNPIKRKDKSTDLPESYQLEEGKKKKKSDNEKKPLNKPKRGGPKKFYVYVKTDSGNIKKVTWGDTTGLSTKINDKEARKSFAARHKCSQQKDKTKASYWACNTPRYAKQLGLSGGGNFYW